MHGTSTAHANTTTIFGASQVQNIAQDPQQRHRSLPINRLFMAIDE
jgi:hypothetical protein